jgi:flagellar P-ring protein FlgI
MMHCAVGGSMRDHGFEMNGKMTMRKNTKMMRALWCISLSVLIALNVVVRQASAAVKIRDVSRLDTNVPNELIGVGLVVGLNGTGDGGDFMPTIRPLMGMLKKFNDFVPSEKELKNASNVAIVHVSMQIPKEGARAGEQFDLRVSALAAKSLKGGSLVIMPLFAPQTVAPMIFGQASGDLIIDDPTTPTKATVHLGGALIHDVLPREIVGGMFTLVLHPNTANMETATAVADQINQETGTETDGLPVAKAIDATSIDVKIPKAELGNVAGFIARIRRLPLPNISEPAKVIIDRRNKTILFTDDVEIATTTVSQGSLTVTIGSPAGSAGAPGTTPGMATMKDLEDAFNLLKVSPDDRISIVEGLHKLNALKADLQFE